MSDLRKYIDLVSNTENLSERRGASGRRKGKSKPKQQTRQQTRQQPAQQPTTPNIPSTPQAKGSVIKNLIKKNPKTAKALGIVAGLSTLPYVSDKIRQSDQSGQSGLPADDARSSRPQGPSQNELADLKAQIDAMIKELEGSSDPQVKKELERIKQKLAGATINQQTGQPRPNYPSSTGSARDYYNRSINFLDRVPKQ
jgi:hypothetical protein